MITQSNADDIVYTNLFTGVHGNYLKGSIEAQGLDPNNLEESDSSKMNFSSGASKPKSWKEIWGSGQGISAVKSILSASDLVKRINNEYLEAKDVKFAITNIEKVEEKFTAVLIYSRLESEKKIGGKLVEYNWKHNNDSPATINDISVFVVPILPYKTGQTL